MERMANPVEGSLGMRTVRLVVRICAALVLALVAATLVLAASGCAVPFVERPSAEVVLVPVT